MAQLMKPYRFRILAVSAAVLAGLPWVAASPAVADTSTTIPGPVPTTTCPQEEYPPAGSPRSAAFTPYEIPFTATLGQYNPHTGVLEGGFLEIDSGPVTVTLGGPTATDPTTQEPYGSLYAHGCGTLQLPNQSGGIPGNPYGASGNPGAPGSNNNFLFDNPTCVALSVSGFPGMTLITANSSASGELSSQIAATPAPNGGLNVTFDSSAKSTSYLGVLLDPALLGSNACTGQPPSVAPGSECTIPIGNLLDDGVPAADLTIDPRTGVSDMTGLTAKEEYSSVVLTSGRSGSRQGQPITGPVTAADATLVANDFAVGAIDANTTPVAGTSGTCTQSNADTLNSLLNLPSPPGKNTFVAPGEFGIHTSA